MKLCVVCGAIILNPKDFVAEPEAYERERRGQARWLYRRLALCSTCCHAPEYDVVAFVYAKMEIAKHNSFMRVMSENRFSGEGQT